MGFRFFFTIFFILYGLMHAYAFWKARAAFSFSLCASTLICFFLAAMTLAPWLVRMIEKTGLEGLHVGLAYASYLWMAAILIFFLTGIFTDMFRFLVYVSGEAIGRDVSAITSAHIVYFFLSLTASVFVVTYGSFEARTLKTEHVVIETTKIHAKVGRIRIVQISDVHLGMIVGENMLKDIIKAVQQAKPDILVSTGDLLDGQPDKVDLYIDLFRQVSTPFGKYAVSGNHEIYLDRYHNHGVSRRLTEKAGFMLLNNDVTSLPEIVTIAGVDDHAGGGYRSGDNNREESMCSKLDQSQFTVLLKHRPVPYVGQLCKYDLQLSGHTHKGQIFPFVFITKLFFHYYQGLYKLNNESYLYVSRGTGTWGPPVRFLAPPEVTIIDLIHTSN
jgi:hypothetical protein